MNKKIIIMSGVIATLPIISMNTTIKQEKAKPRIKRTTTSNQSLKPTYKIKYDDWLQTLKETQYKDFNLNLPNDLTDPKDKKTFRSELYKLGHNLTLRPKNQEEHKEDYLKLHIDLFNNCNPYANGYFLGLKNINPNQEDYITLKEKYKTFYKEHKQLINQEQAQDYNNDVLKFQQIITLIEQIQTAHLIHGTLSTLKRWELSGLRELKKETSKKNINDMSLYINLLFERWTQQSTKNKIKEIKNIIEGLNHE